MALGWNNWAPGFTGWQSLFGKSRNNSRRPRVYHGHGLTPRLVGEAGPLDRHRYLGGFNQAALDQAEVLLVGAGGINGQMAEGLARKGTGSIVVCEPDEVQMSNLHRQPFTRRQI